MFRTKRNGINRVDVQVMILTAFLVVSSVLCVYVFNYKISYGSMIQSLETRTQSIYEYVDKTLDKSTFHEINSPEDQSKPSYVSMKASMEELKAITGVRYLYTAKQNENGDFVYVVDGLPADSEDFRNAGDLIEEEIIPDLKRALNDEVVLPEDIIETTWGHIFISYYPVHEGGQVVGVVGIEFDAEQQYQTYRTVRMITPLIALAACLIACLVAVKMFKRISNPRYQDLANTDQLTGLKNWNAFDLDLKNMISWDRQEGMVVFSIDLDGLKQVNDNYGHQEGDRYIQEAAEILKKSAGDLAILYRVGGDEFVILGENFTQDQIDKVLERIRVNTHAANQELQIKISMAGGFAAFDPQQDRDIRETYRRADLCMYEQKKKHKHKNKDE